MNRKLSPRVSVVRRRCWVESLEDRRVMAADYTLQILHASDFEAGLAAVGDAPRFAAIVDALEDTHANTIVLSSGDNYLPGPFFNASGDAALEPVLGGAATASIGRGDIEIMNRIGFEASVVGNHEFDLGTRELRNLFFPAGGWQGGQFPYITSNVNFTAEPDLNGRLSPGGLEASSIKGRFAPSAVITEGGERIGIVGLTTPETAFISSPGPNIVFSPTDPLDFAGMAAIVNSTVDALEAAAVNKIVLLTQLQQFQNDLELAPLLSGVDIIFSGGSNTISADGTDRLRTNDTADVAYPVTFTNLDGQPIAVLSTDGNYRYVGRLAVGFDAVGVLDPTTIDPAVSGAYPTDSQGVTDVWSALRPGQDPFAAGTKGEAVQQVTTLINGIIAVKDANLFGMTDVFLEGRRTLVRTQETNLGNLTADANLALGKSVDPAVILSLKNGGGIRDSIGSVGTDGSLRPPAANPAVGKDEGDISQLDIENSLRFNNALSLVTVTAAQLKQVMEHAVAASGPGQTQGRFPQIGGFQFSFDLTRPAGSRVLAVAIVNDDGEPQELVVQNGTILGDPNRTFRMVTLNFLAGGGDGYPFATFPGLNRVDLLNSPSLPAGAATFAAPGSEQDALAEYLAANYSTIAYNEPDTTPALDLRVQDVNQRIDTVAPLINEFSISHAGTDSFEYIEIRAAPFTDLSHLTLVQLEGDGAGAGVIDSAIALGTTDADGLYVTPFSTDAYENGTVTLQLVAGFTGSVGLDLDTNNDGVRDVEAWTTSFDSVGINDGGAGDRTYSAVVFSPMFDGLAFAPGGASRKPTAVNTVATNDWVRNDFDLEGIPGNGGTLIPGEAINTPGAPNQIFAAGPLTTATIAEIQGAAHISPLRFHEVITSGVVTALSPSGFYLHSLVPDASVATSEGIFVSTAAAPAVVVGDTADVRGIVHEFGFPGALFTTRIATSSVSKTGTAALPSPAVIGAAGRIPPIQVIEDDNFGSFDPATDGLDFYESLEGMKVQVNDAVATGPTITFGSGGTLNREISVLADNGVGTTGRTPRGGILRTASDVNPERIFLSDALRSGDNAGDPALPAVQVGDRFNGPVVGVMSYDFGNYLVLNTQATMPTIVPASLPRETTNLTGGAEQLTIATFNVENLDSLDPQAKFDELADIIINNLRSPDLLSIEEIQDNNGPTNDAVVAANLTFDKLIQTIAARGGQAYQFRQINPQDDRDGGEPGGNVRVGFLFRADRVTFVDRPGGDATTPVAVVAGATGVELSISPGRIDPTNPAFNSSRKPLVGEFVFNGKKLFVVANHFNSKGGDGAEFGANQPPVLTTEAQRIAQAEAVRSFVQSLQALDPSANVIVMGDLNDFEYSPPLAVLKTAGLTPLVETLPANERYTYVFDGNSQTLDHIMVNNNLLAAAVVDVVHVNAEFSLATRASDHDPVVARLTLRQENNSAAPSAAGNVRIATFNASLNRNFAGQLADDLSHANNPVDQAQALRVQQAKNVAEVIQRVRPDVLLINEFDFDPSAVDLYRDNFLEVSQNGALPIEYPYAYIAPSNTGIASGFDLNNNGQIVTTPGAPGYGDDALGFGNFEGQFGMLLLSKHEIVSDEVRTFQEFLWKDMPGNRLPDDPTTPALQDWYSPAEQAIFRLSSKSHWDVPIRVGSEIVHVLASHPTPPVFDGPEDRNGTRNFDEIRLWADYITPNSGDYIYDDNGVFGGLAPGAKFVIIGDQNSDPRDGDSIPGAIQQLLNNPRVNTSITPESDGGPDAAARQGGANATHLSDPRFDTADFADTAPGNLRADYVLPSRHLRMTDAQVFWPRDEDPLFYLAGDFNPAIPGGFPTSDHRLVWVDLAAPAVRTTVGALEFLGEDTLPAGAMFDGTTVGGLSGLTYDRLADAYYTVSDDPSQLNPARYYTLDIDLADGSLDAGDVTFDDVTTLLRSDGTQFPALSLAPEGITLAADRSLYVTGEGQTSGSVIHPFINQFGLSGLQLGELPIPDEFLPNGPAGSQTKGIRDGLGFKSVTISPDGRFLFAAVENALFQDGPVASLDDESAVRIIKYDLGTGQPVGEFVYFTDTIAAEPVPAGSDARNGLVELVALDNNGTLLALERSFSTGVGHSIKLYQVFAQGAMDVSNVDALAEGGQTFEIDPPVRKELLLDLTELGLTLENIDGMSLGPTLLDGRQSLILVSDNNFSATQSTQFLAFALDLETTPLVDPVVETPRTLDGEDFPGPDELAGDADDPAIWVHPSDPGSSRVIATLKDGALVVFDLAGSIVQRIQPGEFGNPRYNNVDLVYNFEIKQGNRRQKVDLAVISDRENDTLAIYRIDPATGLLSDVAHANLKAPGASIFGIDDGESTAYGLASYTSPIDGKSYVFVSQASGNRVAQLELKSHGNGKVSVQKVREFAVPVPPGEDLEGAQVEGMVVDRELGWLYVGQEGFGIYKYHAEPGTSSVGLLIESIDDGVLQPDLEGLTIYYAGNGAGYLLASSQGDSTYAVFAREGNNAYLGSFGIGDTATIDQANESDGADVINVPLGPNFPFGALIVQDGANDPQFVVEDDGELENVSTNFKLIPWEHVAAAFPVPLAIDTQSFDPRDPTPNSLVNGVAAGDVTTDSAILWARSTQPGKVRFQVYKNANFTQLVKQKDATVTDSHQPVKVLIEGLQPGTQYYYRAIDAAGDIATGRFRTGTAQTTYAGLRFGVSGDWRGELAPFPAVSNADEIALDFFVAVGDTVYADVASPDLPQDQAQTLLDYRIKNAEVYGARFGANTLAELRASTSLLATIDDHEVTNDFAGGATIGSDPRFAGDPSSLINDSELYGNGLTAFQEYNPIANEFYGATGDPRTAGERKLYRSRNFGLDAAAFVLDARSFRDQELPAANPLDPASVQSFLVSSFNPARTMLGQRQIADLKADLLAAQDEGVTWKFVFVPEPIQNLGVIAARDRFEGYAAERTEILKFIHENDIQNVVFVAADIHGTLVNNLTYQEVPGGPQIATTAFEITTGAVAYDQPFGQTVINLVAQLGLLSPTQVSFYNSLPISNDGDSVPNDKDDFLKSLVDGQLALLGYDPVGLNANLPAANGLIDATLIQGDYAAVHTYGWTDFQIDPATQELRVITYGIEEYTADELNADPESVLGRVPAVVSEFVVVPARGASAGLIGETLVVHGDDADNEIVVRETNGKVKVFIDGDLIREIERRDVDKVEVHGHEGNDEITVLESVDVVAWLFGNAGNDSIFAGRKSALIMGGDGDDRLFGGRDEDVLIGGFGEDVIVAGHAGDLLIGGKTAHDDDLGVLAEIFRGWTGPGSYDDRIANLMSLLGEEMIEEDNAVDILFGGQGRDWFLAGFRDSTHDRRHDERLG